MPKFSARHYVPLLTWKRGEQTALEHVSPMRKAHITPIIELPPVPVDEDDAEAPSKTLDEHVGRGLDRIPTAWHETSEFFLDPREVAADVSVSGLDGARFAFDRAASGGLSFVPVTGLERSAAETDAALAHALPRGVCLRVPLTALAGIGQFMTSHGLAANAVDLVIDLGGTLCPVTTAPVILPALLASVPTITAWRSLTLLACAFPASLAGYHGETFVDRNDWISWLALHEIRATLARLPTFGDYAIQSPEGGDGYDPRTMPLVPAIRYTLPERWLVLRGVSSRVKRRLEQYPALAARLVAHSAFYGAHHCNGCEEASQAAKGVTGYGSGEVWRRIGTVNHLVVATDQIVELPSP